MTSVTGDQIRVVLLLGALAGTCAGGLSACRPSSTAEQAAPGRPAATAAGPAEPLAEPPAGRSDMAAAAQAFLASLDAAQRARAQRPFESGERFNWHYVPRARQGLPLEAMTPPQREAAYALLERALSREGYEKATGVVALEAILGQLTGSPAYRDAGLYYLTVFGTPGPAAPWGWRFEGHHLSLNYAAVTDTLVATTPAFMGANPAEVPSGPRTGWRVLADEEDLARRLVLLLDDGQRRRAVLSDRAPRDLVTGADRKVRLARYEGLPASAMTEPQRALLLQLVEAYVRNQRSDWAAGRLAEVRAGLDSLHFAWAGGFERGQGHYYRIHGPALFIEYDNTQDGANHVHSVVRDPRGDFGEDLLRQHYEEHRH
jgi:hypothetical protein